MSDVKMSPSFDIGIFLYTWVKFDRMRHAQRNHASHGSHDPFSSTLHNFKICKFRCLKRYSLHSFNSSTKHQGKYDFQVKIQYILAICQI